MYFVEFHHHLHQNGLPTSGGGKTVRVGPHPSHGHGRQATATAGQVRGHIHLKDAQEYLLLSQYLFILLILVYKLALSIPFWTMI